MAAEDMSFRKLTVIEFIVKAEPPHYFCVNMEKSERNLSLSDAGRCT